MRGSGDVSVGVTGGAVSDSTTTTTTATTTTTTSNKTVIAGQDTTGEATKDHHHHYQYQYQHHHHHHHQPQQLPTPQKSHQLDSQLDSGFLSDSNLLVSGSSLAADETEEGVGVGVGGGGVVAEAEMRFRAEQPHTHRHTHNTNTKKSPQPHTPQSQSPRQPPHDSSQIKGGALSPTRLDSGIDISEQLSSLHLASTSTGSISTSTTTSTSEFGEGDEGTSYTHSPHQSRVIHPTSPSSNTTSCHSPSTSVTSPPPRRSRLGLTEAQVALLQEIFKRDEDGDTQLHVAVMRGFVEVVHHITRLLPHQALLDLANHQGKTALHLAVAVGDSGVARHLLVCGASPVERDRRGNTPLHLAAAAGAEAMVAQLTRPVTVAEVMGSRLAYAPAHTAGLLAADLANYDGQTCIHIAAQGGYRDILQHLTWYGADINARDCKSGRTALHYAVEARDPGLVTFLVESCRVSLTQESYAGLTPCQLALVNGATGIAEVLMELGAPGDPLPSYLTQDDDLDYEEVPHLSSEAMGNSSMDEGMWGSGGMDDLRIGGVPVPLTMALPVSNASCGPFNADRYF